MGEALRILITGFGPFPGAPFNPTTPLVKRLEHASLVERRRSEIDERQVAVTLTAAGRALLVRSSCLNDILVERSGVARDQMEALNRQVQALRDALRKAT